MVLGDGAALGRRALCPAGCTVCGAAISELAMSTLVARGVPLRQARVIVLTVERFTVGHVLEEQAPRPAAGAAATTGAETERDRSGPG